MGENGEAGSRGSSGGRRSLEHKAIVHIINVLVARNKLGVNNSYRVNSPLARGVAGGGQPGALLRRGDKPRWEAVFHCSIASFRTHGCAAETARGRGRLT